MTQNDGNMVYDVNISNFLRVLCTLKKAYTRNTADLVWQIKDNLSDDSRGTLTINITAKTMIT